MHMALDDGWLSKRFIYTPFLSSTALEAMEDALAVEHRENKFLLALRKLATEHRDAQVLVVTAGSGSDCG